MKIPVEVIEAAEKELDTLGKFGSLSIILTTHDGHMKPRIIKEISIIPNKETSGAITRMGI